ncbi:MAG: hypothetical protein HRU78_00105 [Gammaproteobacteria bacterium]|nr:MAG: hypothetical protein HRU78_00105 [Gammaproteobacteria bacterium]
MRIVLFLLLLALSLAIQADTGTQVRQLEKSLARIQQESQSIQQQFMMIQELRRNEISESPTLIPSIPSAKSVPVPKYEDLIRLQQEKQERIEKYTADLNRLYARYNELENEKQAILEQIKSLEQKTEE